MTKNLLMAMSVMLFSALTVGTAKAAIINGFANGGFELDGAPASPAQSWLPAAAGYTRSTDARTGLFSARLASPAFNAAVMLQNSMTHGGLPALVEGDVPTLSFWAKGTAGGTGNVLFALRYLDPNGIILANSGNRFFQGFINPSTWTEITYNLGAVPVGATTAFIEFSQGIGPIEPGLPAGQVLIDDLSLNRAVAIPEPSSLALLGLAGLGALARRRRRLAAI